MIGVFDSGYGGLTIFKEIVEQLPNYNYIYLGDNARSPYGDRSFEVVYDYTLQAVKFLIGKGCRLIILACNTASAKALRTIQQKFLPIHAPNVRVLGVIRPCTEIADTFTDNNKLGLLATAGTIRSNSYKIEINKFFPNLELTQQSCPMLVPLIENHETDNAGAEYFINYYLEELLKKDDEVGAILLACTHYPLIKKQIEDCLPDHIKVISQPQIVAKSLKNYLHRHQNLVKILTETGESCYFTTECPQQFNEKASEIVNNRITSQHVTL